MANNFGINTNTCAQSMIISITAVHPSYLIEA